MTQHGCPAPDPRRPGSTTSCGVCRVQRVTQPDGTIAAFPYGHVEAVLDSVEADLERAAQVAALVAVLKSGSLTSGQAASAGRELDRLGAIGELPRHLTTMELMRFARLSTQPAGTRAWFDADSILFGPDPGDGRELAALEDTMLARMAQLNDECAALRDAALIPPLRAITSPQTRIWARGITRAWPEYALTLDAWLCSATDRTWLMIMVIILWAALTAHRIACDWHAR